MDTVPGGALALADATGSCGTAVCDAVGVADGVRVGVGVTEIVVDGVGVTEVVGDADGGANGVAEGDGEGSVASAAQTPAELSDWPEGQGVTCTGAAQSNAGSGHTKEPTCDELCVPMVPEKPEMPEMELPIVEPLHVIVAVPLVWTLARLTVRLAPSVLQEKGAQIAPFVPDRM